MKKIILSLLTLFTVSLSNAQGTEDFNNATALPTGTVYGDGSFVGNGNVTWNYVHCQTAAVYPITGPGILLRRSNEPSKITATFEGGIGNFSVDTRKGYTGNVQRNMELVINGEVVGQFQHTFSNGETDEVVPFVVNNINVEGTINLELRMSGNTGNQHLVLDNIVWTGYSENTDPEPDPACDIVVNLEFPEYGDVTEWRLLDGDGNAVLQGGPYTLDENWDYMWNFTITTDPIVGNNPPYSLEISVDDYYCDNGTNYTVYVGGEIDIQGSVFVCEDTETFVFPLAADLTACIPSCPAPTGLMVSNVTSTSVDLSWTGTGDSYSIEWGSDGFTLGTGTVITGVQSPYTLSLPSNGTYQFYVKADCGDGDISDYSNVKNYVHGAYNLGDIPTQGGTSSTITLNSTDFCVPEATQTIVVPAGHRIASLQVQYSMTAHNGAYMSEQRSYIYSPTLNMGEDQMVSGVGSSAGVMNYDRTLTFANHQTGSIDFVLRAWRTWTTWGEDPGCSTYNNYVNNGTWVITPTFEPIPQCLEPTGINATNITAYTAEFGWNAIDGAESYTWYVFEDNANPATATPLFTNVVTTNSVEITGLTPETNYDFYVVTNCGTTNGDSPMSPKVDFLTLIACPAPTGLTHTQLSLTSAELSFISDGSAFEIKWGETGFDVNTGGTLVTLENETSTVLEELTSNALYQFYVRQDCSATNDGYSVWSGPYNFYVGYCMPTTNSGSQGYGDYIQSFTTTGGLTNITNPNNGFTNGYSDFTASHSVSQMQGESISFVANGGNTTYTRAVRIWADFNGDGVFADDEILFTSTEVANHPSGTFLIPEDAPVGSFRMRVKLRYAYSLPEFGPCLTGFDGEYEDYTLIVVEAADPCADITAPTADSPQAMTVGQTVGDIVVDGENLVWYSDTELATVVEETFVLEEGSYTFYVTQTIGDCTSEAIEIVVEVSLSAGGFDMASFRAYPNPVKDLFTISYNKNISDVTVVNMLGQIVAKQSVQSTDAQINMSALPAGNYVVKVAVDGAVQTLKVVKQ